jgi:hypothetical protein
MGIHGNPYFGYLSRMRRQDQEPPLKRPADYQFYKRHPDFKDAVAERFEEECADEPRSQHLKLRCKLAWEMLEEEPQEVKQRLKQECDDAHAEELEDYKNSEEGLPSVDPEVQAE